MLLNAKAGTTVAVRAAGNTTNTIATSTVSNNNNNSGNVVISKPTAQVIIKGPLKQLPAGASLRPIINNISSSSSTTTTGNNSPNSGNSTNIVGVTSTTPTASATTATLPAGKLLVQSSTGKQIVVASKNIIKLSPKPVATANTNTSATATTPSTATPSGLHAIQLPGKSGVQYVRVLPNNINSSTKANTSPQKVPLGRPRTVSCSNNNTPGGSSNNNNSSTGSVSSTSKIVMKTTVALSGGSIVPLPSMQTFVPRVSLN